MLTPFSLPGSVVVLEPLSAVHVAGLVDAANRDRATYQFTRVPTSAEDAADYVAIALAERAAGCAMPFAVRRLADDRLVGSTRFLDMEVLTAAPGAPSQPTDLSPPTVVEIGATWYAADAQRSGVNTECKLLLLTHAFDEWRVERVSLKTDARNDRSRTAILRIGARFEGVRRVHMPAADGGLRDTAYYSIVRGEWPAVRDGLAARLA